MARKYDLVVKVGEYIDAQGQTKGRFKNVGVMMEGQNGPYILLERTFNPAGVGGNENKESIIISLYEPKQDGAQQGQQRSAAPAQRVAAPQRPLDDEVPFD